VETCAMSRSVLASALVALAACAGEARNASITLEVDGDSIDADSRKLVREAMRACDNPLDPPGVNVTVKFPDGDTDEILVDCDDGEVHQR
jgi:hypothetical protein